MSAIIVNKVNKKFKIPHHKKTTLFQHVISFLKRQTTYEEFMALNDVNFEVGRGECFGIIGSNGSGKSTLLKIMARVMYPDSGSITVDGKIASFLELGVGFQPELSAKENVYIYSSVLGMSQRETNQLYDKIFEFAELKRFEDMKLKSFSSGMYMRLAFSTAIHTDPDIMLIDEVLAVGDEAFQKKCMQKIREFKQNDKTIVFVSHSLTVVSQICDRAILIDKGRILNTGLTGDVISSYESLINSNNNSDSNEAGQQAEKRPVYSPVGLPASFMSKAKIIIGANDDIEEDAFSEPNYFVLSKYAAQKSGKIRIICIKCIAPGNVKLAVYTDSNGEPGTLLNAINSDIPVTQGWNRVPFPETAVKNNISYWLAFCSDRKIAGTRSKAGSNRRFKMMDYSLSQFPGEAGSGFAVDTHNYDIVAGWGVT